MHPLYIVGTPIGNSWDITLRSLIILFSADIIACEDTRKTANLLEIYRQKIRNNELSIAGIDIQRQIKLTAYYDEIEEIKAQEIIDYIKQGKKVVLVSDGGSPLICDPGYKLVRLCLKNKISVSTAPGPSAVISSLIVSGFPGYSFLFIGYPPPKMNARLNLFKQIKKMLSESKLLPTIIFYESPYRINASLKNLKEIFGDIEITIVRELTKIHEEIIRTSLAEFLNKNQTLKGEITVLFKTN